MKSLCIPVHQWGGLGRPKVIRPAYFAPLQGLEKDRPRLHTSVVRHTDENLLKAANTTKILEDEVASGLLPDVDLTASNKETIAASTRTEKLPEKKKQRSRKRRRVDIFD